MSGRCLGCNSMMSEGAMRAKNAHTGDYEELCSTCRSPQWDNGVVYDTEDGYANGSKPKISGYFNEAEFEHDYVGGNVSSLGEVQDILKTLVMDGYIKMGEI